MATLDHKLWRELRAMRLQVLAIALLVASGIAVFVMAMSTLDSLFETRERYYRTHHFADVFAPLKRAPLSLTARIEALPGVDRIETRVVAYVNVAVDGFEGPVSGHLVGLPEDGSGHLNQVFLRKGRLPDPDRDDEVLVVEEFAEAHALQLGNTITAVINGRRKALSIVGVALSPEYIYQIAPGAMFPDHARYGVFWMARQPLATAFDMDGAFNDLSLTVEPGTPIQPLLDLLDDLLAPYGGIGAYARKDQLSNRFLAEELKQQQTIATVFPVIFFAVGGFLLNVVLARIIRSEREQIATLKAFGYSHGAIAAHYGKFIVLIVALGIVIGSVLGAQLGRSMSHVYEDMYSFPYMVFVLKPQVLVAAALISLAVALASAMVEVWRAANLPPAEGMNPEPPPVYRTALVERLGLTAWLSQPTRMMLRHLERYPLKALLTTMGIAMACGIVMVSGFQKGALDYMLELQYGLSQREDLVVIFTEPTSQRALYSLRSLEGVEFAEGFRSVAAKLSFEHRSYRTAVSGVEPNARLTRLLDTTLAPIEVPDEGIVLTDYLAEFLHIAPGDVITIEFLEGPRRVVQVPVVATARQYLGMNAYLQRPTLNRLLAEGRALSGAYLTVDERYQRDLYRTLKGIPRISGVVTHDAAIDAFYDTLGNAILVFTLVTALLGATIVFGVVYNSMRIALAERHRELASLRVLGFEQREVAKILLGELALLTLLAIPLGLAVGQGLCAYMASVFDSDLYRVPLVLGRPVYAFAALVVLTSALFSGWLLRRELMQVDMVAVLKSRD